MNNKTQPEERGHSKGNSNGRRGLGTGKEEEHNESEGGRKREAQIASKARLPLPPLLWTTNHKRRTSGRGQCCSSHRKRATHLVKASEEVSDTDTVLEHDRFALLSWQSDRKSESEREKKLEWKHMGGQLACAFAWEYGKIGRRPGQAHH